MNHRDQVISLLNKQIGNTEEVEDIGVTAQEVAQKWVDPLRAGTDETNGLIYGLVQSGKTGVLTLTGAVGADEGYQTLLILTSDNDPLYEQTLGRAKEAFPGMDILGKADIKDRTAFLQRIKGGTCAIVMTKNAGHLGTLIENFRKGNLKKLSCLIIDDEADQASLNTRTKKDDGTRSAINDRIMELRSFFQRNTYLQVTATPQALFLQIPGHEFRPKFTVLSHPGSGYVGGEEFFGEGSNLIREFPLDDITTLTSGSQPSPRLILPKSLQTALDTFMIGATHKRLRDVAQNCAFLCHVSTRKADHQHIVDLLRKYKTDLAAGAKAKSPSLIKRLQAAYDDLVATHPGLVDPGFDELVETIAFFSPGIAVKLVNGETDEDVAVLSPYNLFVGGNKLGRGVTIKNLLVSYYGRNPKTPQADTVLQHARMYGYRRADIGLLRLFLPNQLHTVFKAIHKMERGLRELIAQSPGEEFRGVYIEGKLNATRSNVLAPGAIGVYTGGSIYNPAQVKRDASSLVATNELDKLLADILNKKYARVPLARMRQIVELTRPDDTQSEKVWDPVAVAESISQFASLRKQTHGYVFVDRDRGLKEKRRETAGILSGGEDKLVPNDSVTLFLMRTTAERGTNSAWWPQIRFPVGNYGFAFAI
ncbi:MAG TPA: Z1 domain-containing protein [Pyrinomonadaceae bacterium]|nr:Z1 domain-containing protein [Pyrinomonadaceae bacterium]